MLCQALRCRSRACPSPRAGAYVVRPIFVHLRVGLPAFRVVTCKQRAREGGERGRVCACVGECVCRPTKYVQRTPQLILHISSVKPEVACAAPKAYSYKDLPNDTILGVI